MGLKLAEDDAFVLASCLSRHVADEGKSEMHHETRILIEYLAGSATPTPLEKTVVFLARQDLQFDVTAWQRCAFAARCCILGIPQYRTHQVTG